MKRLVWFTLAAFGLLLTRGPAVELPEARSACCDCCQYPGKGTMDCAKCASCNQACPFALPGDASPVTLRPDPDPRIETPAEYGRRLHYRPLLPPPRLG